MIRNMNKLGRAKLRICVYIQKLRLSAQAFLIVLLGGLSSALQRSLSPYLLTELSSNPNSDN